MLGTPELPIGIDAMATTSDPVTRSPGDDTPQWRPDDVMTR